MSLYEKPFNYGTCHHDHLHEDYNFSCTIGEFLTTLCSRINSAEIEEEEEGKSPEFSVRPSKSTFSKTAVQILIKLRTPYVAHVRDYCLDENEKNRTTRFGGVTIYRGPNKLKKRLAAEATRKLTRTMPR